MPLYREKVNFMDILNLVMSEELKPNPKQDSADLTETSGHSLYV